MKFNLKSSYKPAGDQPKAIEKLMEGVKSDMQNQTLLGVTGSGKTFTVANIIEKVQQLMGSGPIYFSVNELMGSER